MDSNWVMPLDMLASGGVIDFDAAAFLLDQKPRYIGHPDLEHLPLENPMYLPDGVKLKDIPDKDIWEKSNDGNLVHNPTWKKVAFGIIAAAGAIAGGLALYKNFGKIKSLKMPKLSMPKIPKIKMAKIKMPDMTKVKNFFSNLGTNILKPFKWIAQKIK